MDGAAEILATAPIECSSCGAFIDQFTHPEQDCGHANEWNRFDIYCKDISVAGRYAAEQGWWLHCWTWRTDEDAPDEPVVTDRWETQ
jgi:hypothetical protein